jgi:thiol-disulfide isomerase/thioredoxin
VYSTPNAVMLAEPALNMIGEVEMAEVEQCSGTACQPKNGETTVQATEGKAKVATSETPVTTASNSLSPTVTTNLPQKYPSYTDFVSPSGFVNSEPFTLADYIEKKIILVEFITYTCINCQRTFPYMKQWHETYEKDGLLVVGIHTPEFAYERDRDNVIAAMKKEGITFPIVLDNEYKTWNAYANRFWPHRYVIDYEGNVVFDHIGEGAYPETEAIIAKLLGVR